MANKVFRPVTPSLRGKVLVSRAGLAKKRPLKTLAKGKKRISGRSRSGQISVRRRGGGHKRLYRVVDFKQYRDNIEGKVQAIEYDPNRSAHIALVAYRDGEKRYVLAADTMRVGHKILSGESIKAIPGSMLPLKNINLGSFIYNIELYPNKGGQLARSAGNAATLLGRDGAYVTVQLPSGEVRRMLGECRACVGVVSNKDKKNEKSGKAGRTRWLGRRPKVRGVVMNPVDHPMGGGEGKSSGGRHPCTPKGKPTKGYKTRSAKKLSNQFIVRRRK
ncbi:50S ribosomal protein L2 [Spirochaetota bacterium]|nr:50S ribosomal protein L2 [Spirochaetota bacterium]